MVTQPSFTLSLREHTYCTWDLVVKRQLSELNKITLEQNVAPCQQQPGLACFFILGGCNQSCCPDVKTCGTASTLACLSLSQLCRSVAAPTLNTDSDTDRGARTCCSASREESSLKCIMEANWAEKLPLPSSSLLTPEHGESWADRCVWGWLQTFQLCFSFLHLFLSFLFFIWTVPCSLSGLSLHASPSPTSVGVRDNILWYCVYTLVRDYL